jgi:hypothetical protein
MPDLNKTRELLEVAFINGWGVTTPIKFDNVVFDDNLPDAFVSVMMIPYISDNVCIGSAITKRIRHVGVLSVKIYVKQNIGTGSAYAYSKQVSDIMSNLTQNNLFTKASSPRRNGETEDGWFGIIVDTPYVSDEE